MVLPPIGGPLGPLLVKLVKGKESRAVDVEATEALNFGITLSLAQIAAGTLPVERVITSRIGMRDVVRKGIQRLADPGGDQVKILVSATGEEAAGTDGAEQEEA